LRLLKEGALVVVVSRGGIGDGGKWGFAVISIPSPYRRHATTLPPPDSGADSP
jgi:hypothetical protein